MKRSLHLAVKRMLDVTISLVLLLVLSPLGACIALWIRLDSCGPAIFRQRRIGKGGRAFEILKFRTMAVDAPDWRNPDGTTYSGSEDPRITVAGRFLRRTSLDELPQLWNVLIGDMSLVGPRPDKDDQRWMYGQGDDRKFAMRPGITGYAAVRGRNLLPWRQRLAFDIEYVEQYSLWLDLSIVLRTIPVVLGGRGVAVPTALAAIDAVKRDETKRETVSG